LRRWFEGKRDLESQAGPREAHRQLLLLAVQHGQALARVAEAYAAAGTQFHTDGQARAVVLQDAPLAAADPALACRGRAEGLAGSRLGGTGTNAPSAVATASPGGVRVALGCVSSVPVRATAMEERLASGDYSEASVRAAAEGLAASLDPPSDVHANAEYRGHLAEVSVILAVLQAAERAKG